MADYKKLEEAENINLERPNTYADQLDAAVANTGKPYQYDFNADQLYQDYKKGYMTEAQKARANVINAGKQYTAAYPDTYVDSAANQQYQTYLAEINRLAPAFENLAWSQQQMENEEAIRQANMLGQLSDTEYGRYRDALEDLYNNRKYALSDYKYDRDYEIDKENYANKVDTKNKAYEQMLYEDRLAEMAAAASGGSGGRSGGGGGGRRSSGGGGGSTYTTPTQSNKVSSQSNYIQLLRNTITSNVANNINAGRVGLPTNLGVGSLTAAGLKTTVQNDYKSGAINKQTANNAMRVIQEGLGKKYIRK